MTEIKMMEDDIIGLDATFKPNDKFYVVFRLNDADEFKYTQENLKYFVPTMLIIPYWMIYARRTLRPDGHFDTNGIDTLYRIIENTDNNNSIDNPCILKQSIITETTQLTRYDSWLTLSKNPKIKVKCSNPEIPSITNGELIAHEDDVMFLQKYIDYWADKLINGSSDNKYNEENYIVDTPIENNKINEYIKNEFDQNLITEYVDKRIIEQEQYDVIYSNSDQQRVFNVYTRVIALNRLILFLENYLGMHSSLTSKLYMYVAITMWKTSMLELSEVSGDPYFKLFQDQKASEWEIENPEKMATIKEAIKQAEDLLAREEAKNPERIRMAEAAIEDAKRRIKEAKEKAERDANEYRSQQYIGHAANPANQIVPATESTHESDISHDANDTME